MDKYGHSDYSGPMEFKVRQYDNRNAEALVTSVTEVYRSVYSMPPYNESKSEIQNFAQSWPTRIKKSGFLFVGAADQSDHLVGFSYGWQSIRGDSWNTKLLAQLQESDAHWLSDCFEFVDLAVAPSAQNFGLGRQLTRELFSKVTAKTAILLTHQTSTKASQMYLRNSWVVLKNNFEVAPGKLYSIMGKRLQS